MNSSSTRPGGATHSTAIVDEFAAAVAALAAHAPAPVVERLARATGDLLESLASRAASQSAGAFVKVYDELRDKHSDLRMIVEDHDRRLLALERGKDGGGNQH